MQDVFDFWWIIYATIAVVIFVKLRSVLGQRTGRERPPYDPYSARDSLRPSANNDRPPTSDNVVSLPGRSAEPVPRPPEAAAPPADRWSGLAAPDSPVAAGLDAIAREDRTFDGKHFIAGARTAYEMIVTAYAEGDRRPLKNLLSRDVYDGFEAAIRDREARGETSESRFVSIDKSDITDADLRGKTAQVTIGSCHNWFRSRAIAMAPSSTVTPTRLPT